MTTYPAAYLRDPFTSGTLNPGLWNATPEANASGGILTLPTQPDDGSYTTASTQATWDLNESYFSFKLLRAGQFINSGLTTFRVSVYDSTNTSAINLTISTRSDFPDDMTFDYYDNNYEHHLGTFSLDATDQPYIAFTIVSGAFNILTSLDHVTWTNRYSVANPFTDGTTVLNLNIECTTDVVPSSPGNCQITELNIYAPTGLSADPFTPGPDISTLVEPFTDLSQWQIMGSVGADPIVVSGAVHIPVETGVSSNRSVRTNDTYTLLNSWVSFRVKSAGSYNTGILGDVAAGGVLMLVLNDYPGFPGLTLNAGSDIVTLDPGSQPLIIFYSDDTTLTLAYSVNDGADWTPFHTASATATGPFGQTTLSFGAYAFFAATEDYAIEFDEINQFNLDGPVGGGDPEPTEVDAADLVMNWNVRTQVSKTLNAAWNDDLSASKTLDLQWNVTVGYLRHSSRHLHRTVYDYLNTELTALGWTVEDSVPFNAPVVVMHETLPDEWDAASVLVPGTVAVTLGDENAVQGQELGGPLGLIEVPIFVDCFMDTDSTALALSLDVRDILTGRIGNARRYQAVNNYNVTPEVPATGYSVEFDDVVRERVKNKWHVVKVTCQMYFPDSEGN